MKRKASLTLMVLGVCAVAALAQEPKIPTPGPEHAKLAYFAGAWTTEGEMKSMPSFPGGKVTSTDHAQMLPGGFFLVTHSAGQGPMGPIHELEVMGYDAKEGVYTYDGFNNAGEHEVYKGMVVGDTWTWTGGRAFKGRFTVKVVSPTVYTFRFDYSPDGTTWVNIMEGKSTKTE